MDKCSRSKDESWDQKPAVPAVRNGKDAILSFFGDDLSVFVMECKSDYYYYTPLLIAVREGNKEIVQFLLDCGASVDLHDRDNRSLHYAAEEGQIDILKLLIDHQQKTHKRQTDLNKDFNNLFGCTLLYSACKGTNINIVKYLLDLGANIDGSDLYVAIEKKREEIVRLLLERGCQLNQLNYRGSNNNGLLHKAAETGNKTIFKLLLDHGGLDVNIQNIYKQTPLHIACEKGNEDFARILIEQGAQVHATSWYGTMLHCAARSGNMDLLKLMMNYEIDVNTNCREHGNETALHVACGKNMEMVKILIEAGARVNGWETPIWRGAVETGKMDIVLMLFDYGCDVNVRYCYHAKLLHELHNRNCIDTLKTLIERGADINVINSHGRSLLYKAVERRQIDLCEYLIGHGCRINKSYGYGETETALHVACRKGYNEIVRRLVESGADIDAKSLNGTTPLLQACTSGNETTVQLLLDYGASIEVNDRRNKNIIEQLLNLEDKRPAEILVQLIVRMKSRKLPVSQKTLEAIEKSNGMKAHRVKCEKEIECMRSDNSAFWRLLMSNDCRCLAGFARNEEMVRVLKSDECKTKFPIYSSVLKNQMTKGLRRKMLLDKVQYFFKAVAESEGNEHLPKLPKLCVHEIFSYFADSDFKNLIKVCDPRGDVEV